VIKINVQVDYSGYFEELIIINNELVEKLDVLERINQLLVNVNGYLYILLFAMAGVGLFYLLYRFLRIFL
jgi:hypothetical protein